MSLDGYAAGPDQSLDDPLGVGGPPLHEWAFASRTEEGVDDRFLALGDEGVGATMTIMGRNMFGPCASMPEARSSHSKAA